MLILRGDQGSARTTLARMLRIVVDPLYPPLLGPYLVVSTSSPSCANSVTGIAGGWRTRWLSGTTHADKRDGLASTYSRMHGS